MRLRSTARSNFAGSAAKPGASAKVSQTMPISATTVTTISAAASTASDSSAKRRASSSPSLSWVLVKSGTKAEAKAPSAKRRRKRLGRRWATKKASATGPVPSAAAMNMSRTKPRTRLVAVRAADGGEVLEERHAGPPCLTPVSRAPGGLRRLGRGLRAVEGGEQPAADRRLAGRVGDLVADEVGHIEDVDGALAEGRDMGRGDVEVEVGDARG